MNDDTIFIKTQTLKPLFELAKMAMPDEIDDSTVQEAILHIRHKLLNPSSEIIEEPETSEQYSDEEWQKDLRAAGLGEKRKILIVDDIGVVTYQLKILFQKAGYDVETAKDIFNAIKLIRKHVFSFIVMDLFVSTEREGFLLLDETKKIIVANNLSTKVVVITASNKGEHKVKCMNRGANMFLQKDVGWQENLFKYVNEN